MAGEVVEVGSGVQKFKPGDKVVSVMSIFVSALTKIYYQSI